MKFNALLVGTLAFTVVFAGCIGDGDEVEGDGSEGNDGPIELGTKGAIRGLVVDDNFRPIQLKEEWSQTPGEFQDIGFVLILETGQRFDTNENGEFVVLPLDPGTYTIRVAADTHEAKDETINVVSGEFAEVTVEARRQYSGGGTVLSQEEVIFIACSAVVIALSAATIPCGDVSGDSDRFDFDSDFSGISGDVRAIVTEMRASQEGYYGVLLRTWDENCQYNAPLTDCIYAEPGVDSGDYVHVVLYPQKQWTGVEGEYLEEGQEGYCVAREDQCRNYAFEPDYEFQTALFPEPQSRYFTDQVYDVSPITWGPAGVVLGTKAQFLQTVFLYELPDEGVQDYCALCEDADIPQ